MKRLIGLGLSGFLLALTLVACGEEATSTPPAKTVVPFTPASNITIGDATPTLRLTDPPLNPTATPTVNFTASPEAYPTDAVPTVTGDASVPQTVTPSATTVFIAPIPVTPLSLPVYTGLKPISLGTLSAQLTQQFGPAGPNVKIATYATTESFTKLTAFYDQALADQGFRQNQTHDLPTGTLLNGKIVLYGKGSGSILQGIVIIDFGPLDDPTLAAFAASAPEVASLKAGSSLVVVVSGLNGAYLSALQKNFTSGGVDTPTPAR